jgi:Zn-finger protein
MTYEVRDCLADIRISLYATNQEADDGSQLYDAGNVETFPCRLEKDAGHGNYCPISRLPKHGSMGS